MKYAFPIQEAMQRTDMPSPPRLLLTVTAMGESMQQQIPTTTRSALPPHTAWAPCVSVDKSGCGSEPNRTCPNLLSKSHLVS
ncbi:hypothetical protein NFI96_003122, partial [Prochilodus magdalenae]